MYQRGKAVNLLTTEFHDAKLSEQENKPEVIAYYNKTKEGVAMGDQMTSEYSCVRATRRWPVRFVMEILDIATLNSYVLWKEIHKDDKRDGKTFLRELSKELVKANVYNRIYNIFHAQQKRNIDIFKNATNISNSEPSTSCSTEEFE